MIVIKRNALVPYTPRQMFELVDNIEDYPHFLQWCRRSKILNRNESVVEASLEIAWSGIHKTFTTRNCLQSYDRINIILLEGPFRHLEGKWDFIALGNNGCRVELHLEFELPASFVDKLFEPIFSRVANSLVDAFCKRAIEIYGY